MGGGGATPHGIYNCRPRASQIIQSAAPNVAGVAGRKGAELRPQPLARGRAEEAPGSNSVYDEPPGQQFCFWGASRAPRQQGPGALLGRAPRQQGPGALLGRALRQQGPGALLATMHEGFKPRYLNLEI